jgi:hypothetical protein
VPLNVDQFSVEQDLDTVEVWGSSLHVPANAHEKCRRRVTYSAIRRNLRSICALFV